MRKLLVLPLLLSLLCTGCSLFVTPRAVYDDLALVKENIIVQKRITDTLLDAVQPQNDKQVEALAMKKLEVEQKFDRIASELNRLVTYFEAEREVGYLINVLDFMQKSRLKGLLLSQVEREDNEDKFFNQEFCDWAERVEFERQFEMAFQNQLVLAGYNDLDQWMLHSSTGIR